MRLLIGSGSLPDTQCQLNTVVYYTIQYMDTLAFLACIHSLLLWHQLPLFQYSLIRISPTIVPRLQLRYGFTAGIPEFTSVLNHNTLPTIHNTKLIRLSMRWFQRKQSRSKGSVLLREGLE
ncbi:hypothetical protein QL285_074676 [Trifolium repens]|nr:hypothetical protein QL285_074675 [Trifolium repens]KAK2373650.1 hypothetical protein QL285_074676 [Trifolium repens]